MRPQKNEIDFPQQIVKKIERGEQTQFRRPCPPDLFFLEEGNRGRVEPCRGIGGVDETGHVYGVGLFMVHYRLGQELCCAAKPEVRIKITEVYVQKIKDIQSEEVKREGFASMDSFMETWKLFYGSGDPEERVIVYCFQKVGEIKYITTPIYYPNGDPHAGHAHTSVMADILKRWIEQQEGGTQVFLSTGVDEHGQKIERLIQESGLSAKEYLDRKTAAFRTIFDQLNVRYDAYVRTSAPRHIAGVQYALMKVYGAGLLETAQYEGLYCEGCEMFKTPSELDENGCCPDHKKKPVQLNEENYILPLEPHRAWLTAQISENPDWIQPEECRNEILQLLRKPLPPLCISRPKSRTLHGIELPFDHNYVAYVWFDALPNYVTTLGYPECDRRFTELWSHSCHLIGKDIAKTHCIYWPIMLKLLELPLFGKIRVHGHWLGADGRKMSKSLGNGVDPQKVIQDYGPDPFRYYMAKNMTKTDSLMGYELIDKCYHSDLVNNISNAAYRVMKMAQKNWPQTLTVPAELEPDDDQFLDEVFQIASAAVNGKPELENIRIRTAHIPEIASRINVYIDEKKPWQLSAAEHASRRDKLLITLLEAVRLLFITAWPIMPETAEHILSLLHCPENRLGEKRFFTTGHVIGEPWIAFMRKVKLNAAKEKEKPDQRKRDDSE